jgi:hypothetical protein
MCTMVKSDEGKRVQRQKAAGQSLVEMALMVPILLVIVAAIVDLGRAIDAYITITNAVREGARYGSLHPTDPGTIAYRTLNEANGSGMPFTGVNLTPGNVSVSYPGGGAYQGLPIRVTVEYDLPLYFGGIVRLERIHLSKSADMVIMFSPVTPPLH